MALPPGGLIGVPLGVAVLRLANPGSLRIGIGVLLVGYTANALMRPDLKGARSAGTMADAAAGLANGIVGGMTGLAGTSSRPGADCGAGRTTSSEPSSSPSPSPSSSSLRFALASHEPSRRMRRGSSSSASRSCCSAPGPVSRPTATWTRHSSASGPAPPWGLRARLDSPVLVMPPKGLCAREPCANLPARHRGTPNPAAQE